MSELKSLYTWVRPSLILGTLLLPETCTSSGFVGVGISVPLVRPPGVLALILFPWARHLREVTSALLGGPLGSIRGGEVVLAVNITTRVNMFGSVL